MAQAAAALAPQALEQLTPENIERNYRSIQRAIAEANSLKIQLEHEFALTRDEDFRGWRSIAVMGYTFFMQVVKPQLIAFIDYQIAIAGIINGFTGTLVAGINTIESWNSTVEQEIAGAISKIPGIGNITVPSYTPIPAIAGQIDVSGLQKLRAQLVAFGEIKPLLRLGKGKEYPNPNPPGKFPGPVGGPPIKGPGGPSRPPNVSPDIIKGLLGGAKAGAGL